MSASIRRTPTTPDRPVRQLKCKLLHINSETAEVAWWYVQTLDPYELNPDLPAEYQGVGRESFARRPGSEIWVWFGDLPDKTRNRLWELHKHTLALPAGLPLEEFFGKSSDC